MIKILERNLNLKAKFKYSKHKKEDLKFTEADNTKISKKFKYTNFTKLEKGVTSRTQTKRYNFLARVSGNRQNGKKPKQTRYTQKCEQGGPRFHGVNRFLPSMDA